MFRRASEADHAWMVDLAGRVYADLGDYSAILPGWLEHTGVLAHLAHRHSVRAGFILLGFYVEESEGPARSVADLLAIAVEPAVQRQGVGRALLEHAFVLAKTAGPRIVDEIRLTVAETNAVGQHLFDSAGFVVVDGAHGRYDRGQRAIRMARSLSRPPARSATQASERQA